MSAPSSSLIAAVDPSQKPLYILAAIAIVALVTWLVVRIVRDTLRSRAAWRALEQELGLRQVGQDAWSATVDGFALRYEIVRKRRNKSTHFETHITIDGLPRDVHLGAEGFVARLLNRDLGGLSGADVTVGDPPFDEAVKIKGADGAALALLDAAIRARVAPAVKSGWNLVQGALCFVAHNLLADPTDTVKGGLELARALRAATGDVPERLGRRAIDDPRPGVRLRALELLLRDHGAHPACARALATIPAGDPATRLVVARARADQPVLRELVADPAAPADVRAAARDALRAVMGAEAGGGLALAEGGSDGGLALSDERS